MNRKRNSGVKIGGLKRLGHRSHVGIERILRNPKYQKMLEASTKRMQEWVMEAREK